MSGPSTQAGGLTQVLAHPLTIAASAGGAVVFGFLSFKASLAAIPPGCMRGSVLAALVPIVTMMVCAVALMSFAAGVLYRLRPNPSWTEIVWAEALGPTLTHIVTFGVCVAVYLAADVPAGCGSPSFAELGIIGLGQLAHIAFLMRRAARVAAWAREDV
jgi:hypothetical protein